MTAETGGEDEPLTDPTAFAIGHEAEPPEVDLQFDPRRWVVHPDGGRGAFGRGESLDAEPREGAVGHLDAVALEQRADLGNGEVQVDPGLDPGPFSQQYPPRVAVAVGPVRAHAFDELSDQLVGQLVVTARAIEAERLGGLEVAPHRLAVDAHTLGDRPFPRTLQPESQQLLDLHHRYLPERHGVSSSTTLETQPNTLSAGGGGPSGWSYNWQRGWSHVTGKTTRLVVPCHWQTTRNC